VEWLGEGPFDWKVSSLRRVISQQLSNGIFKKKEDFGQGVPLVNVLDVYRDDFKVNFDSLERVNCDEEEIASYCVVPGDLFFVRSSLKQEGIAAVALAGDFPEPVVYECHLIRARVLASKLDPRYGSYLLNSAIYRAMTLSAAGMPGAFCTS
jgi:type I restriction enzyme S subunit